MASTTPAEFFGYVKLDDTPEPDPCFSFVDPSSSHITQAPADPKDPEGLLKRCSGHNKKTKGRCSAVIGKKIQQNLHPVFLPTCSAHRDQQSLAGWCRFKHANHERCGRLFKWTPPYFELCVDHQNHPDTPCYFLKLPLELRHEVYRYLLPRGVDSSIIVLHGGGLESADFQSTRSGSLPYPSMPRRNDHTRRNPISASPPSPLLSKSIFPTPFVDLILVSRQVHQEAKHMLYSIATFTIDVRKDGTFMCGKRVLEPRRADGSSHYLADEADAAKQKFLDAFDWYAVKNYKIDILLESWASTTSHPTSHQHPNYSNWDEEVEIYDIRDYVSVVVSGILAKSRDLCKLQVRLCLADFNWSHEQILANTKLIVGPMERLRNVRQPSLMGIFAGRPVHNQMFSYQRPQHMTMRDHSSLPPLCSVPALLTHTPVLTPSMPPFDTYSTTWTTTLRSPSTTPITARPPIKNMFTQFKDFYTKLSPLAPELTYRSGRHAFLHRARVAREHEDVASFRLLRNELIHYWHAYLDQEDRVRADMTSRLGKMLDSDTYLSHEWRPRSITPLRDPPVIERGPETASQAPDFMPYAQAWHEHHQSSWDPALAAHAQAQEEFMLDSAGPSVKRRRVHEEDGEGEGEGERQCVEVGMGMQMRWDGEGEEEGYTGKGKGRMVVRGWEDVNRLN